MSLIDRITALRGGAVATVALVGATAAAPKADAAPPAKKVEEQPKPEEKKEETPLAPAEEKKEETPPAEEKKDETPPPQPEAKADPAAVIDLCNEKGCPHLAAGIVREGLTMAQAQERVAGAGVISGLVASARKLNPALDPKLADEFIAAGASAAHVRAQLFDRLVAAQSPEISHATSADLTPAGASAWSHALKVNKIDVKKK